MCPPPRVLLVEDDPAWRDLLGRWIGQALTPPNGTGPGVALEVATDFGSAEGRLTSNPWSLAVVDLGLPPDDGFLYGLDLVATAHEVGVACVVVTDITALSARQIACCFMQHGARGLYTKEMLREEAWRNTFRHLVRDVVIGARPGLAPPPSHRLGVSPGITPVTPPPGPHPEPPGIPPEARSAPAARYVFRRTRTQLWEIRFPGDDGDIFPDRKGLGDLHKLICKTPRLVAATELIQRSEDPVRAVRARMSNVLQYLQSVMPALANHLEHCCQPQSDSFWYCPSTPAPDWETC